MNDNYLLIVPTVRGKGQGLNIWIPTPVGFSVIQDEAKSMVVTIHVFTHGGAYTLALRSEKSLSRLCPVGFWFVCFLGDFLWGLRGVW